MPQCPYVATAGPSPTDREGSAGTAGIDNVIEAKHSETQLAPVVSRYSPPARRPERAGLWLILLVAREGFDMVVDGDQHWLSPS